MKSEGGRSYKGGQFGAEIVPEKKKRGRGRGRTGLTGRGRSGVKRRVRERSVSPTSTQSSSDSSSSSDESDTLCSNMPPERARTYREEENRKEESIAMGML